MNLQPILTGGLLGIRPLRADDFAALFSAASDPLIWEQHPQRDRYREEVFRAFFDGAIASKGAFAVEERATGKMIGSSRYYGFDPAKSSVIIGYTFLARAYWGGQYNRQLKDLMLGHAFRFVETVLFEIGVDNFRSRRAVEKLGARLRPEAAGPDPQHVVYALKKNP